MSEESDCGRGVSFTIGKSRSVLICPAFEDNDRCEGDQYRKTREKKAKCVHSGREEANNNIDMK